MNFLKARVNARRQVRINRLSDRMTRISARLARIRGDSEEADVLRAERVRLWRRRNDLYCKIKES